MAIRISTPVSGSSLSADNTWTAAQHFKGTPWHDAKAYGAVGDGATDDTAAIQAALNAAAAGLNGARTVFFPAGTYIVRPQVAAFGLGTTYPVALLVAAQTTLLGEGVDRSVIKCDAIPGITGTAGVAGAANAQYKCLLGLGWNIFSSGTWGHYSVSGDGSNITISGLTLNGNGAINGASVAADILGGNSRAAAICNICSNGTIKIYNCRFTDFDSTWVIGIQPGDNTGDIWILNNEFDKIGSYQDTTSVDHDHSSIYLNVRRAYLSGNSFRGRGAAADLYSGTGWNGARTAIELHGAQTTCIDNVIEHYYAGINVTGIAVQNKGLWAARNHIYNCNSGMLLWSEPYTVSGTTYTDAMDGVWITDNAIYPGASWSGHTSQSLRPRGIMLDTSSAETDIQQDMFIRGNLIEFLGTQNLSSDSLCAGISWQANTAVVHKNIKIEDNIIVGALGPGILCCQGIDCGSISRNLIRNAYSSSFSINANFKSGIYLGRKLKNVRVRDNNLIDESGNLVQGIWFQPESCLNVDFTGNTLHTTGSAPLLSSPSTATTAIADPTAAATVGSITTNASGTLNGTYIARFSYFNSLGETNPSAATGNIVITTGHQVALTFPTVTGSPTSIPVAADGINLYLSADAGSTWTKQTINNTTPLVSVPGAGASLPVANTTNLVDTSFFLDAAMENYAAPAAKAQYGSRIIDRTNSRIYQQTSAPSGTAWMLTVPDPGGAPITKTGAYTATTTDTMILVTNAGATYVITLPAANSVPAGRTYTIKKTDSNANTVNVAAAGSDTLEGSVAGTFALSAVNKYVTVRSDGSGAWHVVANN